MRVTTLLAPAALILASALPHAAHAVVYADVGALWAVTNPQEASGYSVGSPSISLSGDDVDSFGGAHSVLEVRVTDLSGLETRSLSETKTIFINNSDPSFTGQEFTLAITLSPIWPMILTSSNPSEESATAAVDVMSDELGLDDRILFEKPKGSNVCVINQVAAVWDLPPVIPARDISS